MFSQNLSYCFHSKAGNKLNEKEFDHALILGMKTLPKLEEEKKSGALKLLSLPEKTDDIEAINKIAKKINKNFSKVVVLGTGGSSLSGQALVAIKNGEAKNNIIFHDNIDPHTFDNFFKKSKLKETFFIVISKSGNTLETLSQFSVCLNKCEKELGKKFTEHFIAITDPTDNPFRRIATKLGIKIIDHEKVGGRFSALTNVGLLPAAIAGADIAKIRSGAKKVSQDYSESVRGAALNICFMNNKINSVVMMPYVDRLKNFSNWYRQVWAESLGKEGHGTTPIVSMGTIDQHSQLQLYLEGPKGDKAFTMMMLDNKGNGRKIKSRDSATNYINNKNLGDIMDASQRATLETLIRHNIPVRTFTMKKLDEMVLGGLIMHFTMETIITGRILGINPFDQPAVEEGKIIARKILERK